MLSKFSMLRVAAVAVALFDAAAVFGEELWAAGSGCYATVRSSRRGGGSPVRVRELAC